MSTLLVIFSVHKLRVTQVAPFAYVTSNQFVQIFSPYIFLNLLKEVSFLSFMLNFDHRNGPNPNPKGMLSVFNSFYPLNMKVQIPQVVVRGHGKKSSSILWGNNLFLILNMKIAISCNLMLCRLVIPACVRRSL